MTRALVTGASSGIGRGIVEVLAGAGLEVHAVARRAPRLDELANRTGCRTHVADVTDTARMADVIEMARPRILVLNAGRGGGLEGVAAATAGEIARTVETNVTATLQVLRLALPTMIADGTGHIVTVSSVAALYPSASALYGGTKAAVGMIARNLRLELAGTGLRVTDIRPGRVSSEFYDVAISDPARAAAVQETGVRELTPGEVAHSVLYAVTAPQHVNISAIELQPLEQTYGGMSTTRIARISGKGDIR